MNEANLLSYTNPIYKLLKYSQPTPSIHCNDFRAIMIATKRKAFKFSKKTADGRQCMVAPTW